MQPNVLLVYSRVGGGHLSAARALAAELEASGQVTPRLLDIYLQAGRFPVTAFPRAYAELARHHPRLWALIYHDVGRLRLDPARVLGPFVWPGLRRVLHETPPALIVSVLPAVNSLLGQAAARCGARLEVVLTDWHSVHPFWVAHGVERYTAPTDSARDDCIRFGAPPERVEVVGIPVRRAFAAPVASQCQPRRRLVEVGLDPGRFTILAMVGAEGSPRAVRNIARLMRLDLDAQLIVVCGHNDALRQRVERLPRRLLTQAVGFVEDIDELMRAADVLVTKAGGLTLAEAFCTGVPVVVHDLLPGQEAGNLAYAMQHEAVVYAPDPDALARVLVGLHGDAARRAELARRGRLLARPAAAQRIAAGLLERLVVVGP